MELGLHTPVHPSFNRASTWSESREAACKGSLARWVSTMTSSAWHLTSCRSREASFPYAMAHQPAFAAMATPFTPRGATWRSPAMPCRALAAFGCRSKYHMPAGPGRFNYAYYPPWAQISSMTFHMTGAGSETPQVRCAACLGLRVKVFPIFSSASLSLPPS